MKKIFNYRLSRARNTAECTFGILASQFRIFHTEINLKLEKIEKVVLACCLPHNFLQSKSDLYLGTSFSSDTGEYSELDRINMIPLQRGPNRNAAQEARKAFENSL